VAITQTSHERLQAIQSVDKTPVLQLLQVAQNHHTRQETSDLHGF